MGYILPLNFEQYMQYQVRGIKEEENFYTIKQVHRIHRATMVKEQMRKMGAELTGKGSIFDKKI
ncbi:MAG: hypothetical protein Q8934_07315 [Bacillota bacterium]|nr:hypothetical protein [Bacillota bacterium]